MAGEEERSFTMPCFVICIIVFCEWLVAAQFMLNLEFWHEQLPAMCMDGRLNNESLANISFSIDDTFSDDSGVHMKCKVPVHVYPCPDVAAGFCRDFASAVPLPTARVSELETGLICVRESAISVGVNVCRHRDFTCATGPCTAYEKAGRLCAANMISPTWYECYYIPSADIPVRTEHTSFPIWWLLLLLVITLPALWLLGIMGKEIMDRWLNVGVKGLLAEMAVTCVFWSCMIILVVVVGWVLRERHAKGEQTVSMTQFDLEVGPDGQVVLPEEEPIPQPSVWMVILIVCAFSCGLPALCFGCLLAISWCKTKSAVAVVSEEDEDEDEEEEDSNLPTDKLLES